MKSFLFLIPITLSAANLTISPPAVELTNAESRQQLTAEATAGNYQEDHTRLAKWTSSNPSIVAVDAAGMLKPVGDGEADITATDSAGSAKVHVKVTNSHAPF